MTFGMESSLPVRLAELLQASQELGKAIGAVIQLRQIRMGSDVQLHLQLLSCAQATKQTQANGSMTQNCLLHCCYTCVASACCLHTIHNVSSYSACLCDAPCLTRNSR